MTKGMTRKALSLLAGALLFAGCTTLDVGDFNNGDLNELQTNPSRGAVITAAQGLLFGTRDDIANRNDYVALLGIIGREGYNFDAADPRFVTEMLIGPLDGGSPAFGGNLWTNPYRNIRNANIVLNALENGTDIGFTAEEVAGLNGFARTIQALDFLIVINTRDDNGAPIEVDVGLDALDPPAAIASKAEVFTHIETLLDDAATDLGAAGATFASGFALTSGFAGFDDPASFLTFNRALRARVSVYQDKWGDALTALGGSFIDPAGSLTMGVFHSFSTGSGDQPNRLFDPNPSDLFGHPDLADNAQLRGDGELDDRFTSKVKVLDDTVTVQDINTIYGFTVYSSLSAPVPIIRNEELILLRAEANIGNGTPAAALADINLIRTTAGGLDPITVAAWAALTPTEQLDELLYNKRYSLLWEGGFSWLDARHYGRLDQLPVDLPSHAVHVRFPFPVSECDARVANAPATGC